MDLYNLQGFVWLRVRTGLCFVSVKTDYEIKGFLETSAGRDDSYSKSISSILSTVKCKNDVACFTNKRSLSKKTPLNTQASHLLLLTCKIFSLTFLQSLRVISLKGLEVLTRKTGKRKFYFYLISPMRASGV